MRKTLFVATAEEEVKNFTHANWVPWLNSDPDGKEVAALACHRHVRDRGGVASGESLRIWVYVRSTMKLPCVVNLTEFQVSNE